jgi:hypothetical protein
MIQYDLHQRDDDHREGRIGRKEEKERGYEKVKINVQHVNQPGNNE